MREARRSRRTGISAIREKFIPDFSPKIYVTSIYFNMFQYIETPIEKTKKKAIIATAKRAIFGTDILWERYSEFDFDSKYTVNMIFLP